MKLNLQHVPSELFSYTAATKRFVSEASDLRGFRILSRIYDDAADIGFLMQSDRTGYTVTFVLNREVFHEGELTSWEFDIADFSIRKYPWLVGTTVTIFND